MWRCSIGLGGEDAPFEKSFDLAKLFGYNGAELLLMWSDLKRESSRGTSFAFSITDRVVDYLGKKLPDRVFGR